jgi:hypothetical protein
MTHPRPEDWLAYLDGEASPELSTRLAEHLEQCHECAAEIGGWRRTIGKLARLPWPEVRRGWRRRAQPWLNYGMAAAVVFTLGIGLGELWRPNARQLRAEVAAEVKVQLRQEFKAELAAVLPKNLATQEQLQATQAQYDQDRRDLRAWLSQFEQQNSAALLSLRGDLETAVWQADDDLQQNRQGLAQLATSLYAKNAQN